MMIIDNKQDLVAVSGGKIMCSVGTSGANCTGSVGDWMRVFTTVGEAIGSSIYDWTH